jgi:hypothetical protein
VLYVFIFSGKVLTKTSALSSNEDKLAPSCFLVPPVLVVVGSGNGSAVIEESDLRLHLAGRPDTDQPRGAVGHVEVVGWHFILS